MHNIAAIRQDPDAFDAALGKRGIDPVAEEIIVRDRKRRADLTALEHHRATRSRLSKEIAEAKKAAKEADNLEAEVRALKKDMEAIEKILETQTSALNDTLMTLPNLPDADVPEGRDEADNVEIRRHGEPTLGKYLGGTDSSSAPTAHAGFDPLAHDDLGRYLGMMHLDTAAALAGTRFSMLSGDLARLERALGNFMIDLHTTEHGYCEVSPPALVNSDTMTGTGQLPKFADDLFRAGDRFWLIPTAEVPLTSIVAKNITDEDALPFRFTAWTPCFRSEAGAAGRDTKGILRVHQFSKVEMVSITTPEQSHDELERMTSCAETVLKKLQLPFRTMLLCAGDMGFGARKTYDIEVWVPSQHTYREISSCSNCGDFQARRMGGRLRRKGVKGTDFVHSLNGSGLAVGRTLLAVIENYQTKQGDIVIPDVLRPYMRGQEVIAAPSAVAGNESGSGTPSWQVSGR